MIDRWWRRDFDRDPAFEDLTDTQRVVVLIRTRTESVCYDRIANGLLVVWLAATAAAIVAMFFAGPPPRGAWGLGGVYLLLPVYVKGWHANMIRRVRHRACVAVARNDARDAIEAVLGRH